MATDSDDQSGRGVSEAKSKLNRLLETENELEAMVKEARRTAQEFVVAARTATEARVQEFESTLADEDRQLAEQIAQERDHAVDSVRVEAEAETERLDALDDAAITTLARYVIDLLVGHPESEGSR
jgi:F0F1-type ATP synthase membrane subunit b/b'